MGRSAAILICLWCLSLAAAAADTSQRPKLLPDYVKVQYAGSIGFVSIGTGYQNRRDRLEGDLYYGYVPKSVGGVYIHALSAKITWHPVKKIALKSFELRPLSLGVLVSYTFGPQYFLFWPEDYPFSYYHTSTALHTGVFVGGRVDKVLRSRKKLGLYYELGATDKEMASYLGNMHSLGISDILNLAVGVKASF